MAAGRPAPAPTQIQLNPSHRPPRPPASSSCPLPVPTPTPTRCCAFNPISHPQCLVYVVGFAVSSIKCASYMLLMNAAVPPNCPHCGCSAPRSSTCLRQHLLLRRHSKQMPRPSCSLRWPLYTTAHPLFSCLLLSLPPERDTTCLLFSPCAIAERRKCSHCTFSFGWRMCLKTRQLSRVIPIC
jgi:hypothetical protein